MLLSRKQYGDTVRTIHLRKSSVQHIKQIYGTLPTSGKLIKMKDGMVSVAFLCVCGFGQVMLEYCLPTGTKTIIAWAEYHSLQ